MPKSDPKKQVTLKDYLLIIFLRKKFFLIPFLIVFFTASIGSFLLPKYYESAVRVKVEEKKQVNPLAVYERMRQTDEETSLVERMKTLTEEILNYERLIDLINDYDLRNTLGGGTATTENLIGILRKRIKVKMISPEIFVVLYEDKNPQQAMDVVNGLMTIFIDEQIKQKEEEVMKGVVYAEDQASIYKQQLEEAEEKLKEYRKEHFLKLPGQEQNMNIDILVNYELQLTNVRMEKNNLQEEINKIERQLGGSEVVIISDDLLDLNPIVSQLNSDLQSLQLTLNNLLLNDPDSDEIYEVRESLEDARRHLQQEIEKTVNADTIENDPLFYQRLTQRLKNAEQVMKQLNDKEQELLRLKKVYEDRIQTLPEEEAEYSRLSRDVDLNSQLYKALKVKSEESRLTAEELKSLGINYKLLEEGRLPLKPSKPKKFIIAVTSFLLGVMSGFGCVFVAELADRSFKNAQDAIGYLDIPYLGSVNKITTEQELTRIRRNKKILFIFIIIALISLIATGIITTVTENTKIAEQIAKQEGLNE